MLFLRLIPVLLLIALPLVASAEKAKTVDELAKMYDSSPCKECHQKEYAEWEKSIHSRSLIGTGRTIGGFKGFITAGLMGAFTKAGVKDVNDIKMDHLAMCFKCHLPQALTSGTDDLAKQLAKAFVDADRATLSKVNIGCIVCHNTKAIVHKWQDGEPEKDTIYGEKEGAHCDKQGNCAKVYTKIKKSVVMKESVMCGQCHGLGPNLEFPQPSQCATIYGSYLHSYIPAGGTATCQDCHKGHEMSAYRDPEFSKKFLDVEVDALGYKFLPKAGDSIPTALVTVKIRTRAGHRVPDG